MILNKIIKAKEAWQIALNVIKDMHDYGCAYLVGGAVRDLILDLEVHDLDFALSKNPILAAKRIADLYKGSFYILDNTRETARALIVLNNKKIIVDIAKLNGDNILDDLKKRDFSINSIAIDLSNPETFIDPLHGSKDLKQHILKASNSTCFIDDPVRLLRAIRFTQTLNLTIDSDTERLIQNSVVYLHNSSSERLRDELFLIFSNPHSHKSLELLRRYGLFSKIFFGLDSGNSTPITLTDKEYEFYSLIQRASLFESIYQSILANKLPEFENNEFDKKALFSEFSSNMNVYIKEIESQHLKPLIILSMIFKFLKNTCGNNDPIQDTSGNNNLPKKLEFAINNWMQDYAVSNSQKHAIEIIYKTDLTGWLNKMIISEMPNREIFHFYNQTGQLGIAITLIFLAEKFNEDGSKLLHKSLEMHLHYVKLLWDAWFNNYNTVVNPPKVITGDDLINYFGIKPGIQIGQILEAVREQQAIGIIQDQQSAFRFVGKEFIRNNYE